MASYRAPLRPSTAARRGWASRSSKKRWRCGRPVRRRVLCWLGAAGEPVAEAITADIDVSASAPWAIAEIANAALEVGRVARVH